MSPKLTPQERLRLIKRVVDGGEKVAKVCREAGISRVLFYRWLARCQKDGGQQKLASLKPHKKGELVKPVVKNQELTPQQRLQMIERVKAGSPVTKVCQDFGVSRTIFYRWLKRYEAAVEDQRLEALWDKKPKVERYWRQTPQNYEQAVLSLIIEHPELSTHKLVEFLPQIGGRPILSNHGVQNVLRRYNLGTYEKRLAYSKALHHPKIIDRYIHVFQNALATLYTFPAPTRKLLVQLTTSFLLGIFTFVILFGVGDYLSAFAAASFGSKIGFAFATFSLLVGLIFFIYSLKYYFTLTLVLGFSRHINEKGVPEEDIKQGWGNGGSLWQKVFGGNENDYKNVNNQGSVGLGGLQANLDHVKLNRWPFVSIHLPMYNEKRVIDRLLTAATSMDYENYEVIVADDSNDETVQLLEKWKGHPRIKISHRDSREGFKGGALKKSLEITDPRTEFILIFDADFLPYPDTIVQFLKYFQATAGTLDFSHPSVILSEAKNLKSKGDPSVASLPQDDKRVGSNIAAIQGYQWHVLNKSENWITRGVRSEYAGSYIIERSGAEIVGALKQIAGSVYMIRKDVLDKYDWGNSITEDFELTLRLYRDGWKVVYTPYIQAPSECVSTLKRLIRQRMRWAEGHSYNVKKMFWQLIRSTHLTPVEKLEVV
ncbi:glycosyltransferase [Candidatus Microgenomates bacterium]|nr:glycosyltransferase [Candidatus Microgenomates bacterium]